MQDLTSLKQLVVLSWKSRCHKCGQNLGGICRRGWIFGGWGQDRGRGSTDN